MRHRPRRLVWLVSLTVALALIGAVAPPALASHLPSCQLGVRNPFRLGNSVGGEVVIQCQPGDAAILETGVQPTSREMVSAQVTLRIRTAASHHRVR
jgi:hypothetical protein